MNWAPQLTATQPLAVPTWTGEVRVMVSPTPSCPEALAPQAQRLPSVLMAIEYASPHAMVAQPPPVPTRTGAVRSVVSPRPSWPDAFAPHAHRLPSVLTAIEW